MSKKAFIFPGQGSQYVGMAKDLFDKSVEAREMIKTADDALGFNLSYTMFNGPEEELKQTDITQPAIFLHSVVIASLIRTLQPDCSAGHSLGEYSALVAAGAIQFYEAIKLVRERGLAMQQAGIKNPGTMAAIIGLDEDKLIKILPSLSANGQVQCANFNSPGQIVISGSVEAVKTAMEVSKKEGAKITKELSVSAAFHSQLMESAKSRLQTALDKTNLYNAKYPVYANVTASGVTSKDDIKKLLFDQVTSPVKWQQTIENMINDGVEEFYEIGPGNVLQGLLKRINQNVKKYGIEKYEDVEKYL